MKIKAYAKINLTLDVLGKRADGYHDINSVMQKIDLYDELEFVDSKEVVVEGGVRDDIILKTILKVKELFQIEKGVKVKVTKNIPVMVGLGGGSSDAASTLLALNELWNLNLQRKDLINISIAIGSDVPFFLFGGSCLVSGKGDVLENIDLPQMDILLVNPGYGISTKVAYESLDKIKYGGKSSSLGFKGLKELSDVANSLHNDFLRMQKDDVGAIIKDLINNGALNASITGKGPTVFGIFSDKDSVEGAYQSVRNKYKFVLRTRTKWT